MYSYEWDAETGGYVLNSTPLNSRASMEPRPVYYQEIGALGFDQFFAYAKDDSFPYMWAENSRYWYRGVKVAQIVGGSIYTPPRLEILDDRFCSAPLQFVDVSAMVEKNRPIMQNLVNDTIKNVYNNFMAYRDKVDIFYVAFSGGKDSVVALDIVQKALPHDSFIVLFGDTQMEFPDTYHVVEEVSEICKTKGIAFQRAKSILSPDDAWRLFGPPATSNRWCCSVLKTSPQITLLRSITRKRNFTGMAFTGIRASESMIRDEYDTISEGKKHQGQFSCHVILEWNSAELFDYVFEQNLTMNRTYLLGNARAGCLLCPNSSGKNDYLKHCSYTEQMDRYIQYIVDTSSKTYTESEMREFIDAGYWRTRRTGRELNFGQDKFDVVMSNTTLVINVYENDFKWLDWAKTIGNITYIDNSRYLIHFAGKEYLVKLEPIQNGVKFEIPDCTKGKDDVRFQTLFRSVIIKSLYCVGCRECEAECKFDCIHMESGIEIGNNCVHCHKCHDVREHCLRYNSIRNKMSGEKTMTGMDRYNSFGFRGAWLGVYCDYEGSADFWTSNGDGKVANKKKDAFYSFILDSGIGTIDKSVAGDKFVKCVPSRFGKIVISRGADSATAWGLILANLAYTPAYTWFIKNLNPTRPYTPDEIKLMLSDVMEGDTKGHGKQNVVDSLKIAMATTLLGTEGIFARCDIAAKTDRNGDEKFTLNTFSRATWSSPDPLVILYSLYKFAEACEGYYQFTLTTLMDASIERGGISPTEIFGLSGETMEKLLNGLSINHPEFITCSFKMDLDSITLRSDKTSDDVLALFEA